MAGQRRKKGKRKREMVVKGGKLKGIGIKKNRERRNSGYEGSKGGRDEKTERTMEETREGR